MNPVGLKALSDLKLFDDGPLRFRAIHLWSVHMHHSFCQSNIWVTFGANMYLYFVSFLVFRKRQWFVHFALWRQRLVSRQHPSGFHYSTTAGGAGVKKRRRRHRKRRRRRFWRHGRNSLGRRVDEALERSPTCTFGSASSTAMMRLMTSWRSAMKSMIL